jgi:hypothetical protein
LQSIGEPETLLSRRQGDPLVGDRAVKHLTTIGIWGMDCDRDIRFPQLVIGYLI